MSHTHDSVRRSIVEQGWDSYWDGENREHCPYEKYTSDYSYWMDGWYDAQMSDVSTQSRGMGNAYQK